jgi:hypothetical protein
MEKPALVKAPSTVAMTTNTTQLVIDLATLARGGRFPMTSPKYGNGPA